MRLSRDQAQAADESYVRIRAVLTARIRVHSGVQLACAGATSSKVEVSLYR